MDIGDQIRVITVEPAEVPAEAPRQPVPAAEPALEGAPGGGS